MKVNIALRQNWEGETARGVGVYTRELVSALNKAFPQDQFITSSHDYYQPGFDLVHFPFFDPFFPTLPFSKPVPTVVTIHDLIPLKYKEHFPAGIKGRLRWLMQRRSAASASHIITDSEASKGDIIRLLDVPASSVSVVPLGPTCGKLDKTRNKLVQAKYSLPSNYLLYVGDINWNKNVSGLIRTFASLNDPTLNLVLVGKALGEAPDIPEYQEISQAIQDSGKKDLIHILGFVPGEDLPNIYNLARAYVQPSFDEGFGLNLLDAFIAGCPVACSSRGSLPEVGGDAVAYFDPERDMKSVVSTLLKDKKLADNLVKQGSARIKNFSWEKAARETYEVYKKLI